MLPRSTRATRQVVLTRRLPGADRSKRAIGLGDQRLIMRSENTASLKVFEKALCLLPMALGLFATDHGE